MESQRKSERTKMAFQNRTGRWGRKKISPNVVAQVLTLHQEGKNIRTISKTVQYYDKNNNAKNLSIGVVHKIIKENKNKIES